MPWQRFVAHVAFEHDENGLLYYRYLVLIVPRQAGKSALAEAVLVWSCQRAPDRTTIYTAQTREMARRRIIEEMEMKRLARSPFRDHYKPRRSIGQEQIRFDNLSQIALVSSASDAGHGLTIDVAVIDEAWAQPDFSLIEALDPATVTRPDPMFALLSTVGDGTDSLLLHYQELGRTACVLAENPGRIAYFEWSAGPNDEVDDRDVWWATHPALGHTITEERLENRLSVLQPDLFARAYLCRRPSLLDSVVFEPALWNSRKDENGPARDGTVTVAVDVAPERQSATVAACGKSARGGHVVVVDRRPGVDWLPDAVGSLVRARRVLVGVVDGRGPAAALVPALEEATPGLEWRQLTTSEVVAATGQFYDAVRSEPARLWHCAQPDLDAAVQLARKRPVGDAWAWGRKGVQGDVTPLVASTLARYGQVQLEGEYGGDLFIY